MPRKKIPSSGDLVMVTYNRARFTGGETTLGIFLASRSIKWGDDYLRFKFITESGVEDVLVWDGDTVEIINETR